MAKPHEPDRNCPLCLRLVQLRSQLRAEYPEWHNAPVPSFGPTTASRLIVGLAPGRKGANRTGRPFTGDHAGDTLYSGLIEHGLACGEYQRDPADSLALVGVRLVNAVRCLPPENKPETAEIHNCNGFLAAEIAMMPRLRVILCLGTVAHRAVLRALGTTIRPAPSFGHALTHMLCDKAGREITLIDSYHCSRYNTQTRRLTTQMFADVLARLRQAGTD